jgi:hypothetical protein
MTMDGPCWFTYNGSGPSCLSMAIFIREIKLGTHRVKHRNLACVGVAVWVAVRRAQVYLSESAARRSLRTVTGSTFLRCLPCAWRSFRIAYDLCVTAKPQGGSVVA